MTPAADTAAPAASSPARAVLKWTRWNDPHEGAFGVSIPQGWSINGGSIRHSPTDIRESVVVLAPDGQVRITVGDDNISAYAAPHAMYGRAGLREGMYTSLGDGTKLQIRRFTPAAQFVREYLFGPALRDCDGLNVISEEQRPDLAAASEAQARAHGIRNMRITTSGVSFSCTWNGRPARGYYAAATAFVPSQMGGIWYVDPLYGYVATGERQSEADKISRHVVESMQVNSDWKRKEDQMAADAVRADNERAAEIQAAARKSIVENQQATSDMIVKGYEARSRVYDEVSRKRENAILGTVDVVDPDTGPRRRRRNQDRHLPWHGLAPDDYVSVVRAVGRRHAPRFSALSEGPGREGPLRCSGVGTSSWSFSTAPGSHWQLNGVSGKGPSTPKSSRPARSRVRGDARRRRSAGSAHAAAGLNGEGENRARFRKNPPSKVLHFGPISDPLRALVRPRSAAASRRTADPPAARKRTTASWLRPSYSIPLTTVVNDRLPSLGAHSLPPFRSIPWASLSRSSSAPITASSIRCAWIS